MIEVIFYDQGFRLTVCGICTLEFDERVVGYSTRFGYFYFSVGSKFSCRKPEGRRCRVCTLALWRYQRKRFNLSYANIYFGLIFILGKIKLSYLSVNINNNYTNI